MGIASVESNQVHRARASEVVVGPLNSATTPGVVRVLGRAFVTNPLHVAVFGPSLERNEAFFSLALGAMKGVKLAATLDAEVVGVIHWVASPRCQFSLGERARSLPSMLRAVGVRSTRRLVSWLSVWAQQDPSEAHLHLGPIAVSPQRQGQRIGALLMERYCAEADRSNLAGYLETDRPENVTFYRKFAFEVVEERDVLGVRSYFMRRPSPSGRDPERDR